MPAGDRISQATYDLKDFVPKSFLTLQKTLSILPASALNLATSFVTVSVPCLAWVTSSAMVTGPWGLVPSPVRRQPGERAQESPRKVGSRPLRPGSLFLHPCSKRSQDSSPRPAHRPGIPRESSVFGKLDPDWGGSGALSSQGGTELGSDSPVSPGNRVRGSPSVKWGDTSPPVEGRPLEGRRDARRCIWAGVWPAAGWSGPQAAGVLERARPGEGPAPLGQSWGGVVVAQGSAR